DRPPHRGRRHAPGHRRAAAGGRRERRVARGHAVAQAARTARAAPERRSPADPPERGLRERQRDEQGQAAAAPPRRAGGRRMSDGRVAEQLALEWLGGAPERRLRHARPGFDELPWDSFDASRLPADDPGLLDARAVWTNGVFTEYASAAAFSAFNIALLE